jgi:hypothetical protein
MRPFHLLVALLLVATTALAGRCCELRAMAVAVQKQHACCAKPGHSAPAGSTECCALTAALVPDAAIALAAASLEIQSASWLLVKILPVEPQIALAPSSHPPPGPALFVAFVLRRSLQAHAPPSFVA